MHRVPEGFPSGIPGRGEDMDGAMQQAPQPARQIMVVVLSLFTPAEIPFQFTINLL